MHRPKTVSRNAEMSALYLQGKTPEEIATIVKLGIKYTYQVLGVRKRPRKETDPIIKKMYELGVDKLEGRERTRMMVRIRDDFTCQDCGLIRPFLEVKHFNSSVPSLKGRIKNLDVHHTGGMCGKNSRRYDTTKNIDGMTTLCHKCHYNRPEHRVKSPDYKKHNQKSY